MLGLARGTVQLFPHDPDWETEGKRLSDQLSQILGSAAVDVRHIGSTAIRTAEAKPILDLAVAARNLPEIDCAIPKLKSAGFLHHAENDSASSASSGPDLCLPTFTPYRQADRNGVTTTIFATT